MKPGPTPPTRRQFTGALAAGLLGAACGQERASHAASLDYRIRNALVVDGTGAPASHGDLGIRDGRFVPPEGEALRELDADGLVAAPGFVDIHSHGDLVLASSRPDRETLIAGRLAQGITTEVIGNCGLGAAPLFGEAPDLAPAVHAWMTPEGASWRWASLADYFAALETRGLPLNVAALVPHGLLRLRGDGPAARSARRRGTHGNGGGAGAQPRRGRLRPLRRTHLSAGHVQRDRRTARTGAFATGPGTRCSPPTCADRAKRCSRRWGN